MARRTHPAEGKSPASRQSVTLSAGIAAILRDQGGRILLHRRRLDGRWAPLSGHVEPGESVGEAILREIGEETGLAARIVRLIGVYSDPSFQTVRTKAGLVEQFVSCLFECRVAEGSFHGSSEGDEWEWFEAGGLPDDLTPYARIWLEDAHARKEPVIR